MSSDRCEELLVGLVSGDLGEEQERAARAEIGRCSEHAAALRKLDLGMRFASFLPSVEPRPELDEAILSAARAKVAQPKAAAPVPAPEDGLFARALAVLRRMATGQQLAMSTVMLLVVAIGLWYLPARHEPDADGDTVMAPQLAEEMPREAPMAPSAAEPARRRDEERVAQAPVVGAPSGPKPEPSRTREVAPARPATQTPEQPTLALRSATPARRAPSLEPSQPDSIPGGAGAGVVAEGRSRASRARAPMDEASRESEDFGALAFGDDTRARGAGRAAAPASPSAAPAPAPPAAASRAYEPEVAESAATGRSDLDSRSAGGSAYDRGMVAYQAGRYAEAAELFSAAATSGAQAASALHYLGRSHRAAGRCAIAVRDYERLLGGFPAYGQRTQAMIEAADCYQRTGHLAAAERWLERATQTSPSSVAARRELTRVRARRAADAPAAETGRAAPRETAPAAAESF